MVLPAVIARGACHDPHGDGVRSSMMDELNAQYIKVATAKGLPFRRVVGVHALRNVTVPVMTLGGWEVIRALAGYSVVVETGVRLARPRARRHAGDRAAGSDPAAGDRLLRRHHGGHHQLSVSTSPRNSWTAREARLIMSTADIETPLVRAPVAPFRVRAPL